MKWCILRYHHIFLFILSNSFLSTTALPAFSKSFQKYGSDNRETLELERYSYPEEEIENVSEDCSSTAEDSEMNLRVGQSKAEEKREINLPDEGNTNTKRRLRKHSSRITDQVGLKATKNQTVEKHPWWFNPIYPGTKWCGDGDIAANYDDLGPEEEADKCCRTHDYCQDYMLGGETKYNLTNNSTFVSLSCECDNKFYECLRNANTIASNLIGFLYFNLLARQCFTEDYPTKCKTYSTVLKICTEFEVDVSVDKIYRWLLPKKYKKMQF